MGKKDLTAQAKSMILHVRSYFEDEKKLYAALSATERRKLNLPIAFNKVTERTAAAVGVCVKTVSRVTREYRSNNGAVKNNKKTGCNGRKLKAVDSFEEGVIRRNVLDFYAENTYPTVNKIHQGLQADENFPQMSISTLRRILKRQLKFKFLKFGGKPVPMERNDIAASRYFYLQMIKFYRKSGFSIYYQDESWINANQSLSKGWYMPDKPKLEVSRTSYADVWLKGVGHRFVDKLIGGFVSKPSGAGKRLILNHIGSEHGFLKDIGETFIGKKNSNDYHNEMNSAHFENWFAKVLEILPNKSVIVLDQATYHKRVTDDTKNPTTAWRKQQLIQWLEEKNVNIPVGFDTFSQMTVPFLLTLAKENRVKNKYVVEQMIQNIEKDIKILWLPVAHCELNPVELIWAYVKRKVAELNSTFKIKDVLELTKAVLESVSVDLWKKCVTHVMKLEDMLIQKENIKELFVESQPTPFIIPLHNSSSSEESEWEDEDDDMDWQ